ncbi:MAG: iron-sulfur cluster assembly protein [Chitinophagales bacterium]|nr:iron-sulfur cluster assembly protein [Chitinophagales bacterium]MCZ2392464.1 iron-sulfur cluster assembly protein [Chitinophagales bacterium]
MKNFIEIQNLAIEVLQDIFDPEIPVNIYDLGLIYEVNVDPENNIHIVMTLTSPNCPVAESLPLEVENKLKEIEGVKDVKVDLTFEPVWTTELMTEAAKLELGFL